jgi:glycosyltransferase involved in cell wall biosynthesis
MAFAIQGTGTRRTLCRKRIPTPQTEQSLKISIITVVYNGVRTLADCIESVLGQTYPDLEYLIIDGGSTDGTVELVQSYGGRISVFRSEPDQGIYDAMNKGVGLATGDVIGILNADDLYAHREVLSRVAARFGAGDAPEAVYGDLVYVRAENPAQVLRYWQAGTYAPGAFRWGWMPPHPTFFVRRSCYDRWGTFDLRLRSAADYELMLRFVHRHGARLGYLPEVLVRMRAGGVSNASWKNRLRANQEDRLAWKLNQLRPYFFTLTLKPLRKLVQFVKRAPEPFP